MQPQSLAALVRYVMSGSYHIQMMCIQCMIIEFWTKPHLHMQTQVKIRVVCAFVVSTHISMTKNGIHCKVGSQEVALDPRVPRPDVINFVSHAHLDHLPTSKNNGIDSSAILSSYHTRQIARLRGFVMRNHTENADGFELVDSGHVLGSKGLLFGDVFYTGDICTRGRGFLQGARIPKCKTLITECTFGLPEFKFPNIKDVVKRVNQIISQLYERGVPVILMGYQLGKAQTLTDLFGHWQPLYFHDSVLEMNLLHDELGIRLADGVGHAKAESCGLLEKRPWIMISPPFSEKSNFIQRMKSRYGAVTMGFSGWAHSAKFPFGCKADYSIQLSDHCDYADLIRMVRHSGAEMVYTTHGFTVEFAQTLRNNLGIEAEPLSLK